MHLQKRKKNTKEKKYPVKLQKRRGKTKGEKEKQMRAHASVVYVVAY